MNFNYIIKDANNRVVSILSTPTEQPTDGTKWEKLSFPAQYSDMFKIVTEAGNLVADAETSRLLNESINISTPTRNAVPLTIAMRQFRLALLDANLLSSVDQAIDSIQDPKTKASTKIEWEYATTVLRDSALVTTLASLLNLTSEQVDQLFIAAAAL